MRGQTFRSIYKYREWEVDLARRELRSRGVPVPIGGRAFEIIETLVQAAGELVSKDDLMARVWPGIVVEENTLAVHVSAARKALGLDRRMLETAIGRGYRLLGNWTLQSSRASTGPADRHPTEELLGPIRANLPMSGSDLIGRGVATRRLRDLLSAYRVVTLTGAAGIGKTSLALEVARRVHPTFDGDCWFVELGSLSEATLVPSAVARVFNLKMGGEEITAEGVARAIGQRKTLLILDNCEHVIDAAAILAETLVRMCPQVTILATSREALSIAGEYTYRVPPLDVPAEDQSEPANIVKHGAVQLLIARTKAQNNEFSPRGEDFLTIATICNRLDGIPLAIEFAASRAATLGLSYVASNLDDRFKLLVRGRRTALARHQTLRATLDWSYELLPEAEKGLLCHLAVFVAGFSLDGACAVMGRTRQTASWVAEGVANLVAKSLVTLDQSVVTGRWRLLETIRAYSLEKLIDRGEAEETARRHAEFLRDLFASIAPGLQSSPTVEDMSRYARELNNVRVALDWAFSSKGDPEVAAALTGAFAPVWLHLTLLVECCVRSEHALSKLGPDSDVSAPLRLQLHMGLGVALLFTMGSVEKTRMALGTALDIAESMDKLDAQLRALWALTALYFYCSECREGQSTAERLSRVARRIGDPSVELLAERLIGNTLQHGGKNRQAQRCFEKVIRQYVAPKDIRYTMWFHFDQRLLARAMLARVLCVRGFVDNAVEQAQVSLEEAKATDHKLSICGVLHFAQCPIALMTGDLVAAERAVAMLIDLTTSVDATFWRVVGQCFQGKLLIGRGEFQAGSTVLRTAFDTCDRTGWTVWYPEFLGAFAEGLAGLGQFAEALTAIDQALARADRGGERWYVPELLRIKGELLLQATSDKSRTAAENSFYEALEVAHEQDALLWELRGARSLAHLRMTQDRWDDARQVLASVYNRFTEGFDAVDLRAAKAMLETLSGSRSAPA